MKIVFMNIKMTILKKTLLNRLKKEESDNQTVYGLGLTGLRSVLVLTLPNNFYSLWCSTDFGLHGWLTGSFSAEKGEDSLLKYLNYLSRLIMISPVLIIGFKLSNVTIAISALIVGAILQTIYRKMEKNSNSHPEEN